MPSPIFNEFVQGVLDSQLRVPHADGKHTTTTIREQLRTLLIEKTNLDKAGQDIRAVDRALNELQVAITNKVIHLHENREPKLDQSEFFKQGIMMVARDDQSQSDTIRLSSAFIQALYLNATQNSVKKHSAAVVGTAIGLPVVAFAATAITMLAYNFAVTGMVFGGGSLATALGALSFLPLAFVPGGLVGVLVFAALIAATALVVYGVGVGITALLTTNGVDAVKVAGDDSYHSDAYDVNYAPGVRAAAAFEAEEASQQQQRARRTTPGREGPNHSVSSANHSDVEEGQRSTLAGAGANAASPATFVAAGSPQPQQRRGLREVARTVVTGSQQQQQRPLAPGARLLDVVGAAVKDDATTFGAVSAMLADPGSAAAQPPAVQHTAAPFERQAAAGSLSRSVSPHAAAADGGAPRAVTPPRTPTA